MGSVAPLAVLTPTVCPPYCTRQSQLQNQSQVHFKVGHEKSLSFPFQFNSLVDSMASTKSSVTSTPAHPRIPVSKQSCSKQGWARRTLSLSIVRAESHRFRSLKAGVIQTASLRRAFCKTTGKLSKVRSRLALPLVGTFSPLAKSVPGSV